MSKKWVLPVCLALLTVGCAAPASDGSSTDSGVQSSAASPSGAFYGWENLEDLSGQPIDFTGSDAQGIALRYALGWSLDSTGYRRIEVGDQLNECSVVRVDASYLLLQDAGQAPTAVCEQNNYQVHCGKALSGVLVADSYGLRFHPYYKEGTVPFPLLSGRTEELEAAFLARSTIEIAPGNTVSVQPVGITIPFAETDGTALRQSLLDVLGIETTDAVAFGALTEPRYFDAQIKFSEIVFSAYAQSVGEDFTNTTAVGRYDREADLAVIREF